MSDLGIALVWLAVQVTAVALAGLGLTALAARRAPGAGASAALAALAAAIVLAVLACCPMPSWWEWGAATRPEVGAAPANTGAGSAAGGPSQGASEAAESSPGAGIQPAALLSALRTLWRWTAIPSPAGGASRSWPACVAAVTGAGTAFGLFRLLLGLWAIRRSWQQSRLVADADLLGMVEELRPVLGVARPVAVREADDLAAAATVGWRRPALLLPADWREWTAEQRRAVVAHELAHVGRGDFAAWLLARLSVALHFWHPLVRCLAARLQLHQELAADDTAARLAGGRAAYLRALAALALRSDGRASGWPAPAFLSRKGLLLRRVDMLRVTEDGTKRPASRAMRRLTVVVLFALALAASALRSPGQEAVKRPPAAAAQTAAVVPFDLSLLGQSDGKEDGVFGVRPAAILNRPGGEPALRLLNPLIDNLTAPLKAGGVGIHIEDVEQVMGRVYIRGENKPGKHTLMMSLTVLRTTRDMDWAKLRDECGPELKHHHWKGETYVSTSWAPLFLGIPGIKGDLCLWAANARTLVIDGEDAIKAHIDAKVGGAKLPLPDYAADWDRVSRGLFAVALDNRGGRLIDQVSTDAEKTEFAFLRNVFGAVVGIAGADDFQFDLRASADTPKVAAELVQYCEGLLAAVKKIIEADAGAPGAEAKVPVLVFFLEAANGATVRREGTVVTIHAEVASGLNAVIATYVKDIPSGKY
jgi:beta-lactamase regulating signal transducer with metallopeptidase domain